jgi:hypothetical protein
VSVDEVHYEPGFSRGLDAAVLDRRGQRPQVTASIAVAAAGDGALDRHGSGR